MKPVIMDMREMTLSKEVYDKKPQKFFAIFIYGLLFLIVTALVWAYFGRIDRVIRAEGIIRPHAQPAIVLSSVPGELVEVFYYNGKQVAHGDVLFTLNTFHLENEKRQVYEQLQVLEFERASLDLLLVSIETGVNMVGDFNPEFSARFDNINTNIITLVYGANNLLMSLEDEEASLVSALGYAEFELGVFRMFEVSVNSVRNMFTSAGTTESARKRETYQSILNQFLRFQFETESVRFQIESVRRTYDGLLAISEFLESGANLFPDEGFCVYESMLTEYTRQLGLLEVAYNQAYDEYLFSKSLLEAGRISHHDYRNAYSALQISQSRKTEHTMGFKISVENGIRDSRYSLENLLSQENLLRIGTLGNISTQSARLEAGITDMNNSLNQNRLQRESILFVDSLPNEAAILRFGELNRTLAQINQTEQELQRLTLIMSSLDAQIDESTVRSPIDGEVLAHVELVPGGFVLGGTHVLSVIPTRVAYLTANIFVGNADIGQLSEGMTVHFEIAAMPRRDFGHITGEVTRIAADIITEQWIQGYFIVESELEDRIYYDSAGNGVRMRVGMGFEARIVTDRQRILHFLLDRLNMLWN